MMYKGRHNARSYVHVGGSEVNRKEKVLDMMSQTEIIQFFHTNTCAIS